MLKKGVFWPLHTRRLHEWDCPPPRDFDTRNQFKSCTKLTVAVKIKISVRFVIDGKLGSLWSKPNDTNVMEHILFLFRDSLYRLLSIT